MAEYDAYKYNESDLLMTGTRWAYPEEIKESGKKIELLDENGHIAERVAHAGLPLISDGKTVYVDDSDAHSLIIGSTGSKKTRLFCMPTLDIMRRAGESVVVTDPKGELYALTASAFENSGYKVAVLNLRDPQKSNGWNILRLARDYYDSGDIEHAVSLVDDLSHTLFPDVSAKVDPFWNQTSRSILRGLAMMMVEGGELITKDEINLYTLQMLSANFDMETNESTVELMKCYPDNSTAVINLKSVMRGSERTFDNIRVCYDAGVQMLYVQPALIRMLSTTEIDFSELGKRKTVLYIIMPDEKATLHGIVSMAIKQCYEHLISTAQQYESCSLPVRVNFLLDEFGNLPNIPDMSSMISAARSRNIRFFLIIQGLYQLSARYGAEIAHTIKGNCANWVFLTSRELELLEEISTLCGVNGVNGERLITVSQLQRLKKERGEVLMLIGRRYPFINCLPDISQYPLPKCDPRPYPSLTGSDVPLTTLNELLERAKKLFPNKFPTFDLDDFDLTIKGLD